jgi:hypothetical protein
MVNRLGCAAIAACAILAGSARPALAQQTLNFSFGYFTPKGEDARVDGDILITNRNSFVFDVKDFNSASVGGEWLVALGNYLEGGAGCRSRDEPFPACIPRSSIPTAARSSRTSVCVWFQSHSPSASSRQGNHPASSRILVAARFHQLAV